MGEFILNLLKTHQIQYKLYAIPPEFQIPKPANVISDIPYIQDIVELPVGTKLYRSGSKEIKKVGGGYRWSTDHFPVPHYFTSYEAATLYGEKGSYHYTCQVAPGGGAGAPAGLRVFLMSPKRGIARLQWMISRIGGDPEGEDLIVKLLFLYGYNPLPPDAPNYADFKDKMVKFMKREVAKYQKETEEYLDLIVSDSYPEFNESFNRISISSLDKSIFQKLFTYEFKNKELRDFFQHIDGIYTPPIPCGAINKYNFLTIHGVFPEEYYFKDGVVEARIVPTAQMKYESITQEAFRITGIVNRGGAAGGAAADAVEVEPDPIEADTAEGRRRRIVYLNSLQQSFIRGVDTLEDQVKRVFRMFRFFKKGGGDLEGEELFYRKIIKKFAHGIHHVWPEVLQILYTVLVASYKINPQLFVGLPDTNPFLEVDGSIRNELLLYTVLHDVIGAFVKQFETFCHSIPLLEGNKPAANAGNIEMAPAEEEPEEEDDTPTYPLSCFYPVASGGALFSVYTFGEYRRLTKDIDVKIIQDTSKLSPEELTWRFQERRHTWLGLAMVIWGYLLSDTIDTFVTQRLHVCIKHYIGLKPKYGAKLTPYTKKNYTSYIGMGSNYNYTTETILQKILFAESPTFLARDDASNPKGIFFNILNQYLVEVKPAIHSNGLENPPVPIDSLQAYTAARQTLLGELKVIKETIAKYNDIYIKAEQRVNIEEAAKKVAMNTASAAIQEETAKKRNIYKVLESFDSFFPTILGWMKTNGFAPEIDVDRCMRLLAEQREYTRLRPNLNTFRGEGSHTFKLNYFLSLWVKQKGGEDYGLIDLAMDSDYSTQYSYQNASGITLQNTVIGRGNALYRHASFLQFLRESSKLNSICSSTYIFDAEIQARIDAKRAELTAAGASPAAIETELKAIKYNPFNRCSPDPDNRANKIVKYRNRYDKCLTFTKQQISQLFMNPAFVASIVIPAGKVLPDLSRPDSYTTLEECIEALEGVLDGSIGIVGGGARLTEYTFSTHIRDVIYGMAKGKPHIGGGARHRITRRQRRGGAARR